VWQGGTLAGGEEAWEGWFACRRRRSSGGRGGGGVAGSVAWEGHGAQLAEELGRDGSLAGDECHVGLLRSPVEEGWRVPLCSC
jgi:hypothetical protein